EGLTRRGRALAHDAFFDTVTVRAPGKADGLVAHALEHEINIRRVDADTVAVACDELTARGHVAALLHIFTEGGASFGASRAALLDESARLEREAPERIPVGLRRRSRFLGHPIFNSHRSETEMMRFLRRLEEKDIALNRSMIPLGSCTMKLNAAAEIEPITWPKFADLHPFAPADPAQGYAAMIRDLEALLCRITGMAAVTLQPNAGSQGEYAGLLVIRAWHKSRGQGHRNICLIPSSAHGTNPASAVMAGMDVVVVGCDASGNIDL